MNQTSSAEKAARPPSRNARRRSRELALQGVYQWLLSGEQRGAIEAHIACSPGFERADREHFQGLLNGTLSQTEDLHALISPHLDRPAAQLSPVEHAVLMVASFELVNHREIPYRVVINEAVELTKSFGGTDGYRYVNGVLDKVAAAARGEEVRAGRPRG